MERFDKIFVFSSFIIQIILLIYFAIRKWNFDLALKWGWVVYALAIPALIVSLVLIRGGKPWFLWFAGFLYLAWAVFGYMVDIARPIEWRSPIFWPAFLPYVLLYMATLMFYWWPLATIQRLFWYIYAGLFIVSTYLNISSHK